MSATSAADALGPILLVDDDPAVRDRMLGLLRRLGVAADDVQAATDLASARAACATRHWRLAIVDVGLPDGCGLELVEWLIAQQTGVTPIVMSSFGSEEIIVAAVRSGALGYLLKERDDEELVAALGTIARGGAPIDPFVARHILRLMRAQATSETDAIVEPPDEDALTARELEILGWVAQGLISRDIARRLQRSPQTVECHIKNIFRKMSVSTRTEAVSKARQRGLLH